jgi:DNA-binding transcriptional LysR family regulator
MDVELRHLRYFVAVAEELSFTRAAARLHIAQPPLSTQIRRLEEELGVALFDRSRRQIALTEAGELLLGEARRLLAQTELALAATRRAGTGESGRLTIGFVPSASTSSLPEHLRAFRVRHPGVELFLRELPPDELVAQLHAGALDVSFLYRPTPDERLRFRVVAREPLVAALPAEHRLAGGRAPLRMAQLRAEPFVLPARHHMPGLHARVLEACAAAGFEPDAVQKDVWLMQTILGLVAAGLGVALVPASVRHLNRTGVAFRRLRDAGAPIELGALWRAEETSATVRNFLAALPAGRTARPA